MTKEEVSNRVLYQGKPLALHLFTWNEETYTFSSRISGLVIDFKGINDCTFSTGSLCTFKTGIYCIFNTRYSCIFKTGGHCTFITGCRCVFDTEGYCTFSTENDSTFITGEECVIVRRDIFEVIRPKRDVKIKLNVYVVRGYTIINPKRTVIIDGTEIELSEESYQSFVKQFKA